MNRDKWKNHVENVDEERNWKEREDTQGLLDETQEVRKEKRGTGPGSQAEERRAANCDWKDSRSVDESTGGRRNWPG